MHHEPGPDVKVTVVLPCYNEQDHVGLEVERICGALDESGYSYEVLAIDDKSTDEYLSYLRLSRIGTSPVPPTHTDSWLVPAPWQHV